MPLLQQLWQFQSWNPSPLELAAAVFAAAAGANRELKALDFRERAPLAATRTMFLDKQGKVRPNASIDGYLAVGTPGTVAGLYEVQRRYGKLAWKDVVAPPSTWQETVSQSASC